MAARRLVRRATKVAGLRPIAESLARTMSQRNVGYGNPRPVTVPMNAYARHKQTLIAGGYATALVDANGNATAFCGPMSVGTIWYPQAVAISTTTGANDLSTAALYLSPQVNIADSPVPSTQIGGQSYAGGGDTVGFSAPPMWQGYFIFVVWQGATPGDTAAMQVYGNQTELIT